VKINTETVVVTIISLFVYMTGYFISIFCYDEIFNLIGIFGLIRILIVLVLMFLS
jgi:hypothetical protein